MTPSTLPGLDSPEEQLRQMEQMIERWRRASAGLPRRSLEEIMRDMAAEANANGLTQEILDEILNEK